MNFSIQKQKVIKAIEFKANLLVFNIKKLFNKVPGLRTKLGTYAAALFLLKDTFKEDVDPKMWEQQFMKYLKENNFEFDKTVLLIKLKIAICHSR